MEPPRIALPMTGALVVGAIALTESFALLPAAIAAYGAAWWVLRLGRETPAGAENR
ncbi:hypothetical protein ABLE68_08020 [Nocardioides sp. CN2-186]|uniref:hypothetical protein n=1 Tax=Nocardioides tweenelious TaxID=3156607 RepID=UPI0032B47CCC